MKGLGAALAVLALFLSPAVSAQDEMEIVKSGAFTGQSDHAASGSVTVQRINESWLVVLEPDFRFDGAPDTKIAFGNGSFDASTVFSPLYSNSGLQDYMVPERIDPLRYSQIWLWDEQANVPVGVAELE